MVQQIQDVVMMEWAISFTPNDIQDMTHAQAAKKINPKIVLNIRLGVGPAVVGKDIIVEDLSFKGSASPLTPSPRWRSDELLLSQAS